MNNEIVTTHARKLRYLRKLADKKQIEVADFLNLSQQAYSKLENGETSFSDEAIEKISHFFGITPADFENIQESVYVGNNAYNHSSNNHSIDERFLKSYEVLLEQNRKLFEDLIKEKDERIKLLETFLNIKENKS